MWGVASAAIVYGFARIGQRNSGMNGEKYEERRARYAMAPILQAEQDRLYLYREKEILKKEAEIMKDVPGWVVGENTYYTDRWVSRHGSPLNKNHK